MRQEWPGHSTGHKHCTGDVIHDVSEGWRVIKRDVVRDVLCTHNNPERMGYSILLLFELPRKSRKPREGGPNYIRISRRCNSLFRGSTCGQVRDCSGVIAEAFRQSRPVRDVPIKMNIRVWLNQKFKRKERKINKRNSRKRIKSEC